MLILQWRDGAEEYFPFHTIFKVVFEDGIAKIVFFEVDDTWIVSDEADIESLKGWLTRGGQFTLAISAEA